ncbi:MAG: hypothetical protein WAL75_03600 [Terracidiphilus sp.]
MIQQRLLSPATGVRATCGAVLLASALLLPHLAAAQAAPTITIRILDGKTGQPINPTNLIIRVDRKDEPNNEGLKLNGADPATALLPQNATVLSVQGSYSDSMEVYINCDVDAGKDSTALKWYSIADILKTGMVTPDLCFKGKFHNKFNIVPKPGEFVFFVRTHNWHDVLVD